MTLKFTESKHFKKVSVALTYFFFFKENSEHLSLSFSSLCFFLLLQSSLMSRKRYVNDLSKGFGLSDIEGLNENG